MHAPTKTGDASVRPTKRWFIEEGPPACLSRDYLGRSEPKPAVRRAVRLGVR